MLEADSIRSSLMYLETNNELIIEADRVLKKPLPLYDGALLYLLWR